MSAKIVNRAAFLRETRDFPLDPNLLRYELDKSYVDTALAVNARIIGFFPTTHPAITGEAWFVDDNKKRQTIRQVYTFGSIAAGASLSIPHNITGQYEFTRIWGTCKTALPDSRPIPYASVAANNNIDLRVDATNIIIANGAAGPNILSGIIILEWMSQFSTVI